jgi:hypothetical protein
MNLEQRQPRERDPAFLKFVRTMPCVACGKSGPSDAAHIRAPSIEHGKRYTGKGEKPSDRWAVPLCRGCHRAQHKTAEPTFWARLGKNPFNIAVELYRIGHGTPTTRRPKPRAKIRQRTSWPVGRTIQSRGFPKAAWE